jgi:hypothetical protein
MDNNEKNFAGQLLQKIGDTGLRRVERELRGRRGRQVLHCGKVLFWVFGKRGITLA